MAELKVIVRESPVDDRHQPTGKGIFEAEVIWRPLYIQGGEVPVSYTWRKTTTWHVVGDLVDTWSFETPPIPRALCNNNSFRRRRAMTWREMREMTKWRSHHDDRICKSCERIMNARARARGVR